MGETQGADPDARRISVVIIGCATVVGVVLIMDVRHFRPEFEDWLEQDFTARFRLVIAALTIITSGPVLGLAGSARAQTPIAAAAPKRERL
jgi:hypothetical protein